MLTERTPRNFEKRTERPLVREVAETESRPSGFRSAALMVNTRSRPGRTATKALGYLRLLGVPVAEAYTLDDPSHLAGTVREAIAEGHDLIVLGGGDGSVGSVADLLVGTDVTLGLLPLGTANDFARTMGIPLDLERACETVARGVVATADLGLAGDRHFVNVASMGLGGAAAEEISPRLKRAAGALAYPLAALRAYGNSTPFEVGFVFPEGDHESTTMDDLVHVAVGNGRYYGGGMVVAPGSGIEDEVLDVYAIQTTDPLSLGRIAWGLRTGEFVSSERVHHWRTREVCLITDPRLPVNLDGELVRKTPRSFSVVPNALKVLVPTTTMIAQESVFASLELAARG